jgi:thiol-disulfide isomerase/thioredoxin
MIIERVILLAVVVLSILAALVFIKRQQKKQAQYAASEATNPSDSAKLQIIYFWSTQCSQCLSIQTPIIDKLISIVGSEKLSIKKVNVNESPDIAKNWSVKTVPSTYLLDGEDNVLHINNGLTTEKKLLNQINI